MDEKGRSFKKNNMEDEMDLKRGPWTAEEDFKLTDYIATHGEGRWNSLSRCAASQLQAIKSIVQADTEPSKRPYTRPSILFAPKEAADFDIESIHELGLKGLEVLGNKDERFKNFANDLFSHKSREIDRELLSKEENAKIDASISSYLRLLSGYLQFRASLETLEYLIRRFKVHIYNVEDVVLCALPYHDTHAFVRIVQLITTGNTKWKFLDGVKNSGAPPPRSVIVQQCIRDMNVLEALCDYGSRTKKYQPSKPVVSFSTAVVVEVLGSVAKVDGDIVKQILPFVDSGLQSAVKGCLDQQAGALMVVGMLATRATLNDNLIKRFMRSIIDIAREHAKESSDPHWLRLSFMALINLVQLQSVDLIPKKALDLLKEIRDISGVLLGLSKEFNVKRFLAVLLDSLLLYSSSDDQCLETLVSIIDNVPVHKLVDHLISKVFSTCMTQYQKNKTDLTSSTSGRWAKKILAVVSKKYCVELRAAVSKFMEDTKGQSKKEDLKLEILSRMMDGNSDMSLPFADSKLWFRLHHPKAAVRCAALSSLNSDLKSDRSKAENLVTIQDAIVRQLWDDDLAVVQAALSLDQLPNIVTSSSLLDALLHVVKRCVEILLSADVVALSLKIAVSSFCNQADSTEKVASAVFPFLLIQPKSWNLNLHVLTLVKDVSWPLFKNLVADDGMSLVGPLFKLLGRCMSNEWVNIASSAEETSVQPPQNVREITQASISSIQQTVLLLLKDIFDSPDMNPLKTDITSELDVKMLVEFTHSSNDGVTRNYIFSLFTSIVKIVPDRVLDHIISILTLVGESTIDSHSKSIFEEFISSVIPFWLSKTKSEEKLLEIFVKVLPDIVEHRRRSIVAYLLRVIGEQNGLPSLLVLLFQSLISRKDSAWLGKVQTSESFLFDVKREWEYAFAVEICEQYTSSTWLSSLVMLLQTISKDSSKLLLACFNSIRVVTSLLQQQSDRNGTRKVLGLISARAKDSSSSKLKQKRRLPNQKRGNPWLNLDEAAVEAFGEMCEEIINVIVETDDESGVPAKRAAISTLEVLASRLPSGHPIFSKCLATVADGISSKNLGVSSSCVRTTGALISVLGPKALVELPRIMKNLVQQSREVSSASTGNATADEQLVMLSVLVTLEAVIDKLGGFLNPHLGDIIRLMVLHPEYVSDFDKNLKSKANAIRRLLTEKIPVRLTLQPLLRIYDEAVTCGDASLVIAFDMLENLVAKMDRASVVCNHAKIFDQCLVALDIRRQSPATIQNVDDAERSVINATVTLTKKLTESEFKPLFIRSIDWAESDIVDGSGNENKSVDRSISFYGLVNRLCESHIFLVVECRSIFVPYFKFMLDSIVSHLTSAGASVSTRKKKKAKLQESDGAIPPKSWHLRALVLSSLKNCFLHDTGSLKFLDANNFQVTYLITFHVLLKPIVSQLVVEPPSDSKEHPRLPSVEEVDELVVLCIGQMGVASGSDLLWKPLNHEVLMQTRSEKLRARMLSLRSVKQLMDNLKEEYLVLLAETIPFLVYIL
ncbi:hypothetical protein F2Q70_00009686 [Brassica cretica]|uniref:BP28 C-terminal domain-containing protein n=1 Tax=Brassica cretica TaxID=69181 RepID=A0A8S9LYS4_BRACR|nr:hypothetical protein F2Q70_00009686 [Brassica cretica]